eukprot:1855142-Amphidinium_carterae.1
MAVNLKAQALAMLDGHVSSHAPAPGAWDLEDQKQSCPTRVTQRTEERCHCSIGKRKLQTITLLSSKRHENVSSKKFPEHSFDAIWGAALDPLGDDWCNLEACLTVGSQPSQTNNFRPKHCTVSPRMCRSHLPLGVSPYSTTWGAMSYLRAMPNELKVLKQQFHSINYTKYA